jgi:hypothetical protein
MAYWQLGNKGEARNCFGKGVEWMTKNRSDDKDFIRFRIEAEQLIGAKEN